MVNRFFKCIIYLLVFFFFLIISLSFFRELNELRKPSSENPEILRFFKYMKAAKDGQDNQDCELIYWSCTSQRSPDESVPMMTTYNEINKLMQARNAKKINESSVDTFAESSTVVKDKDQESKSSTTSTVIDEKSESTSK